MNLASLLMVSGKKLLNSRYTPQSSPFNVIVYNV